MRTGIGLEINDLDLDHSPYSGEEWTPFIVETVTSQPGVFEPHRSNHFAVWQVRTGQGQVSVDDRDFEFEPDCLFFSSPYQFIKLVSSTEMCLKVVKFHANFLCVETFHHETGCSGPLFGDHYQLPYLRLTREQIPLVTQLFNRLEQEVIERTLGWEEATLSLTKLLLIDSARWKGVETGVEDDPLHLRRPVIQSLKKLIEENYCKEHSVSYYAQKLDISPKTLGKYVRESAGQTPSDLIQQRILTHAKWQLLHTLKPVKQIAAELGYADEHYFSRLFKSKTGVSPLRFRSEETLIRQGSNLSSQFTHSSIQ